MGASSLGVRELGVAAGAQCVAAALAELVEHGARILAVRVVTARAGQLIATAAEQEIASFPRVDRAPAGVLAAPPALPGVRVAREQDGVALGAGAVLRERGRERRAVGVLDAHERAHDGEARP